MDDKLWFQFRVDVSQIGDRYLVSLLDEACENAAIMMAEEWKTNLLNWDLYLYGIAVSSIYVERRGIANYVVTHSEQAAYLKYHEYGAGVSHDPHPHEQYWPNKQAIKSWVMAKGMRWVVKGTDKLMTIDQMVYLIQRKQHKVGLMPKPAARPANIHAREFFNKAINQAMARGIGVYEY